MDFRQYPRDKQLLKIVFLARSECKRVKLSGDFDKGSNVTAFEEARSPRITSYHEVVEAQLEEWKLVNLRGFHPKEKDKIKKDKYCIEIEIERLPFAILFSIYLPLWICVFLTMCSFANNDSLVLHQIWFFLKAIHDLIVISFTKGDSVLTDNLTLEPSQSNKVEVDENDTTLDRLNIVVTLLLAVMTFQQYSHEKLPVLPYLTNLDQYIIWSLIFIFLVGFFHVLDSMNVCIGPKKNCEDSLLYDFSYFDLTFVFWIFLQYKLGTFSIFKSCFLWWFKGHTQKQGDETLASCSKEVKNRLKALEKEEEKSKQPKDSQFEDDNKKTGFLKTADWIELLEKISARQQCYMPISKYAYSFAENNVSTSMLTELSDSDYTQLGNLLLL